MPDLAWQHVHTEDGLWDALVLHLGGVLEAAVDDGAEELGLEKEVAEAGGVDAGVGAAPVEERERGEEERGERARRARRKAKEEEEARGREGGGGEERERGRKRAKGTKRAGTARGGRPTQKARGGERAVATDERRREVKRRGKEEKVGAARPASPPCHVARATVPRGRRALEPAHRDGGGPRPVPRGPRH